MASVSQIREALKTAISTISGLEVYATVPGQVMVPAAVIAPQSIAYDSTMGRGSDDFVFVVTIFASTADDDSGQDLLDGYLAGSGSTSVTAAVEADRTLGGVVDFARVAAAQEYGHKQIGQLTYVGVEILVEVTAHGSS